MSDSTGSGSPFPSSFFGISGTAFGTALTQLLLAPDIEPGSDPSYQICKTIWLYHPLGQKMVESPINWAQSQQRTITCEGHPDDIVKAFVKEWRRLKIDRTIKNTFATARAYGISSIAVLIDGFPTDKPIPPAKYATETLSFNVFDPLNTAGSLVLNQNPNADNFQKSADVTVAGHTYHRSRVCIVMHEQPVYIAYTTSAFGFVGRSVYQRALYPLKSFVQTMRTDDMISRKAGLIIAKMKAPGSIINRMMQSVAGIKRSLLQAGETDNVLGIDTEEAIESLNLQNIDGAGTFARGNILKNIATAADMPAIMLENETLTEGFGEGTEDNKNIARYIDRIREDMEPLYDFFTEIVQYRAWNEEFFKTMQVKHPKTYGRLQYAQAFSQWQNAFESEWPSLLQEPDSEKVKTDDVRLRAITAVVEALLPAMDPENKARVIEWAQDNINNTEMLFKAAMVLDIEALKDFDPMEAMAGAMPTEGGGDGKPGQPKEPKPPSFNLRAA